MRFEDIFDLEIEALPGNFQNIPVPRLILQPLAENIIKYGLVPGQEECIIRISIVQCRENYLYVTIENSEKITADELNRIQMLLSENQPSTSSIGMKNIHTRLQLYYHDDSCGLEITRSNLGGLCVTVIIRR